MVSMVLEKREKNSILYRLLNAVENIFNQFPKNIYAKINIAHAFNA